MDVHFLNADMVTDDKKMMVVYKVALTMGRDHNRDRMFFDIPANLLLAVRPDNLDFLIDFKHSYGELSRL